MSNLEKGLRRARAAMRSSGAKRADTPTLEPAPSPAAIPSAPAPPFDVRKLREVEADRQWLADNRIVTDDLSPGSASYKILRTRVLQRMRRNGWQTLAVTGAGPGEGKSLTAINLAIQLARHVSTSVVLVDLDLRNPSLHRRFGIDLRYGLADHLDGSVSLERIGINPGVERLGVLMNDQPMPSSSDVLTSPKVASLVETLKAGEDRIVVFDLPPVLAGDDVLAFAPLVDAVLLVVAEGRTTRASLAALGELLQNVNLIGTVLNRSSEEVSPYYYGPSDR